MSACPVNVWNHAAGCACTSNGTITAEAMVDLMAGTAFDSSPPDMFMGEDEFDQMFGGTVESPDGVAMWMDYPADIDATIAKDRIWSVIEGDQNENLYLRPGDQPVNRTAWVVTEQAWGNPNIEVLWHDESEMDRDGADAPACTCPPNDPNSHYSTCEFWRYTLNPEGYATKTANAALAAADARAEPTPDQTYCDVGMHQQCSGYTEDEADPESCMCQCHDDRSGDYLPPSDETPAVTTEAHPAAVFGPGRPAAAASAIHEMHTARAEREANPWSDATFERLRRAERIRDDYSEYGDTFTHH